MYAKLFASLYQGTLRGRAHEILVFTNLLAHTGKDGTVDKHFRAIADETGLTLDEVKAAIAVLEAADPESRSQDEEGARIVRMDEHRAWGWRVVNHAKYRAIRSEEDRAEQNRLAQQRFREKQAADYSKQSKPRVSVVSPCRGRGKKQMQQADAISMSKETKETPAFAAVVCLKSEEIPAESKPDTRTKNAKLAALKVPDFPSEREFDAFVSDEFLDNIGTYKGGLYQDLCARKWHEWNEPLAKWVPVRDWKSYVTALDGTIEDANTNR
jgi:hypothetical protein